MAFGNWSAATKRYVRRGLILAFIIVGVAFIIWRLTRPHPIPVVLATIERGRVEATIANTRAGAVKACRRARLALPNGGQISRLLVKKGDRVRAGQILLELWNEDAMAQVRVAEEQARAAAPHADEACVTADVAEREAARAKQLLAEGFVARERADRAESDAAARRAGCAAAKADVERAQAQVSAARATVARTILRAPFAGVVADVTGELGEFTTPSPPGIPTPPAVDLIDDACLYVAAPIDEVDAPRIRVGMPARISLDAFSGQRFSGHVRAIAPYVLDLEKQARTVDVEVAFEQAQQTRALLVGYSADVEIVLASHDNVVRVPTQALLEGKRVLVYRDGVLEQRQLQTGLSNWEFTEVTQGLDVGERVVVSLEREGVRPGAHAQPDTTAPATSGAKPAS